MNPNPALKALGFAADDRVVIVHTDDIGMCQASITAFADLWEAGQATSGAVMVPCPWFPEAARYARGRPEADLGVHLTLTSEWETYRWGPVSTRNAADRLMDAEGFFPRTVEEVWEQSSPEAAAVEMRRQVELALQAGMAPTHADTHMGAVAHPRFIPGYIAVAQQYRLPPMLMRLDEQGWIEFGMEPETALFAARMVQQLEEMGMPLIDQLSGLELDCAPTTAERIAYAKKAFDEMKPGITHFIIHPSVDTPELRSITPDWPYRVADYHAFMDDSLRQYALDQGIHFIGYRPLKELMPQGA